VTFKKDYSIFIEFSIWNFWDVLATVSRQYTCTWCNIPRISIFVWIPMGCDRHKLP